MTAKKKYVKKPPSKINKEWFTKRMVDQRLSLRGVAKLMKLEPSSLSRALSGERRFQIAEIEPLSRILHVSVGEVARHAGVALGESGASAERVALVGWIDLAKDSNLDFNDDSETIDAPPALPPGAVAVQVRAPNHVADGEILFVEHPDSGVASGAIGRKCLARLPGGAHVVGYLRRGYKAGAFNITGAGGETLTDVKPEWAAAVLWIKSP